MLPRRNQTGFSHMILVLAVVVIAVLAVVAYRVANNQEEDTATSVSKKSSVAAPDTIKSNSDLSKTQAAVKDTPIESDLNPADLNEDVNSLL